MSVLSDSQILSHIYEKKFRIEPCVVDNIQASSIDLTLGSNIELLKSGISISPPYPSVKENRDNFTAHTISDGFVLRPGDFIIAQIQETLTLPNTLMGQIHNRNSLIRLGINVGLSSYINPGYSGKLPIAIHNIGKFDFTLTPGMRICQLLLISTERVISDYGQREDSKYQGEVSITLSKLSEDRELKEFFSRSDNDKDTTELVQFLQNRISASSVDFFAQLSSNQKKVIGLA